jgi:hypothetical protein
VVNGADLHKASSSVGVEDGAVGVVTRSKLQSKVVVVESGSVVHGLKETITLFLELLGAVEEERRIQGAIGAVGGGGGGLAGGGGGGRRSGRGEVFLLSAAGFSHCRRTDVGSNEN